jgi:hypothetical protein
MLFLHCRGGRVHMMGLSFKGIKYVAVYTDFVFVFWNVLM